MIERIHVIGSGRVGSAVAARLGERGVALSADDPDVVLLCVPDTAIADVARGQTPGRGWIGHVSGATPLAALDPHERRFSLHPLQTFDRSGDPGQLDGAWAAVTRRDRRSGRGRAGAGRAPGTAALRARRRRPDALPRRRRFASNYLVTLQRAARAAGRPGRRARAADAADDRERLRAHRPDRARRLGDGRGAQARDQAAPPGARAISTRRSPARRRSSHEGRPHGRRASSLAPATGLVPTMGALHAGHLALLAAARAENDARRRCRCSSTRPSSRTRRTSPRIRATRRATSRSRRRRASTSSSRRRRKSCTRRASRRGSSRTRRAPKARRGPATSAASRPFA